MTLGTTPQGERLRRLKVSRRLLDDRIASVRTRDGALIVRVHGDLDLFTGPQLRSLVREAVATRQREGGPTAVRRVVMDLAEVDFADTAGLDGLADVVPTVRACGCDVRLACVGPRLRRLLDLVPVEDLLPVYDGVPQALENDPMAPATLRV